MGNCAGKQFGPHPVWEGRLPGQKTIENEDKAAISSYRPESNFGTSDTVGVSIGED